MIRKKIHYPLRRVINLPFDFMGINSGLDEKEPFPLPQRMLEYGLLIEFHMINVPVIRKHNK